MVVTGVDSVDNRLLVADAAVEPVRTTVEEKRWGCKSHGEDSEHAEADLPT